MDKKNTFVGVLLLAAACISLYFGPKLFPPPPTPAVNPAHVAPGSPAAPGGTTAAAPTPAHEPESVITRGPTPNPSNATFATLAEDSVDAHVTVLQNDFVEVLLTDFGGAIRAVAMKKYPAQLNDPQPFVFNAQHTDPMLALVDFPGLDRRTRFQLVSATDREVVYQAQIDGQLEVTRRYTLPAAAAPGVDPYQLRHVTTFRNLADKNAGPMRVAMSVGTAGLVSEHDYGTELVTGYSTGKDHGFVERSKLQGGGLLSKVGIGSSEPLPYITTGGPLLWSSVQDQFFVSILTPDKPAVDMITRRVELPALPGQSQPNTGITANADFDVPGIAAGGETTLGLNFYVGPKEYKRLANADVFKADQDHVMRFGFFSFFAKTLLTMMTWLHGFFAGSKYAWGIAIILTTLLLKGIFLPLTLAASKSAKRMQKVQPEMKALREKFKDNPQKMQAATMELFKKHRVNPMGGCLPMLITLPFFWGFFTMLRSASELRFQPFLWAHDLSAPDTIAHVLGLPINILPILMGATMVVQMRLTPQPTVDNAQAKIFKFMPYMFALFCYNFSCALALYSTVNGIFTIGQQLIINRMKDPAPVSPASTAVATAGPLLKNVTPKKKKK
ncbi:YidC/Oxa1 family insertase periplasmic-domain containing protein [Horticoccus luteus]|uniref:Membrane protein insertase YidC n=1 Tax=Horticoccus luteus TaxID=2862869 RepID=A0A8F9TW96_9BACT|nr:YidC/Oxa1 family insertase periplasmic-domain containing protein [Horticoccus luteus]QYM79242.1 YidC/Oxa1 family insertase periplasmic-domain containing protein [Horticoccus luteus]